MNADTKEPKEPRKDSRKEGKKDDSRKTEAAEDDGATRALSAIAGALARSRGGDETASGGEPASDEPRWPRGNLVGNPPDAAAHALSAIARKHAVTAEGPAGAAGLATGLRPTGGQARRRSLYERLVENEDDIVGLIAYALSKQRKKDWLAAFSAETGRSPREEELAAFLVGEGTDKQLRGYREQAAGLLRRQAESMVADARPDMLVEAVEGRIRRSLGWWKFVPAGLAGAIFVLAGLALLAFALPLLGVEPGFSVLFSKT